MSCLTSDETTRVFKEVHSGDHDKHQGSSRFFKQLINLGYYCPTMEADAVSFAHMPTYSNRIYSPVVECTAYLSLGHFTHGP